MRNTAITRVIALGTALAAAAALAACNSASSSEVTSEVTSEAASEVTTEQSTEESVDDAYSYLANLDFSEFFDDNGYFVNVVASDYVKLPENYMALSLPKGADTVDDETVENYINTNILAQMATTEPNTDRAAELGDSVNIDYVGSIDGVEFAGGNSGGTGYDLVLGSGSFIDNFEDQIVGHMPGDTFDVTVTFPENYGREELSGKEAVFVTTLNYVNEQSTPELTDEFVQENLAEASGLNTAQEVRDYIREQMVRSSTTNAAFLALLDGCEFTEELPEALMTFFNDLELSQPYYYAVAYYGTTLETFLQQQGYNSAADFLEAAREEVESNAKQILIMQAIAEAEGFVCDDDTFNEIAGEYLTDLESYVDSYGTNYLKMTVLQSALMDQMVANATFDAE